MAFRAFLIPCCSSQRSQNRFSPVTWICGSTANRWTSSCCAHSWSTSKLLTPNLQMTNVTFSFTFCLCISPSYLSLRSAPNKSFLCFLSYTNEEKRCFLSVSRMFIYIWDQRFTPGRELCIIRLNQWWYTEVAIIWMKKNLHRFGCSLQLLKLKMLFIYFFGRSRDLGAAILLLHAVSWLQLDPGFSPTNDRF